MQYIVCNDENEFDTFNSRFQQYLSNNIDGYNANSYASHMTHPVHGNIAIAIRNDVVEDLSESEKNRLETLTQDWFPSTDTSE
jgi:hypothetical protein